MTKRQANIIGVLALAILAALTGTLALLGVSAAIYGIGAGVRRIIRRRAA